MIRRAYKPPQHHHKGRAPITRGFYAGKVVGSSGFITADAGSAADVWVEYKNIGSKTWDYDTKLATHAPRDRNSVLYNATWLSEARAAACTTTVPPGSTYRFRFSITIPQTSIGCGIEQFTLVQENVAWFDDTPECEWDLEYQVKRSPATNKILYLSCHQTLEHSEMALFQAMGLDVFPVGTYTTPQPFDITRWALEKQNDPETYEKFMFYHKDCFSPGRPIKLKKEFTDDFDTIINCHWFENFDLNAQLFRNKQVIWRTIGLSNNAQEQQIRNCKKKLALKIVRMTPKEPTTAGCDAMIRTHIDPDYFSGWIGDENYVLTVQKWTRLGEHGRLANEYQEITNGLKRKLCGKDNKGFDCIVNDPTSAELQEYRRHARAYLSLATQHAATTYTFIEAMMSGMPVVSVGKKLAKTPWFENDDFIEHGVSGFVSDNPAELRGYIELLLGDYELAKKIGMAARQAVIGIFHPDIIMGAWKKFFVEQCGMTI